MCSRGVTAAMRSSVAIQTDRTRSWKAAKKQAGDEAG